MRWTATWTFTRGCSIVHTAQAGLKLSGLLKAESPFDDTKTQHHLPLELCEVSVHRWRLPFVEFHTIK